MNNLVSRRNSWWITRILGCDKLYASEFMGEPIIKGTTMTYPMKLIWTQKRVFYIKLKKKYYEST